jgi:hypothetical protein
MVVKVHNFVSAGGISTGEELNLVSLLHSTLVYEMILVGGIDRKSVLGASAIIEEEPFINTWEKIAKNKKDVDG